ncbi:MAG: zf-HC2 domain-containing protein [Oscillospiraceae bacterium]|nr:zf-HC2 domain-containing protein [Oscillospiraceae bacterium]MBQ6159398.1 zf-HC2 domain-containing protein [Oscillospiraceae bacterium]
MNCTQAIDLMSAMLDGELSPEQAAELQAHLAVCPECARLMEAMQGLDEQVAALREPAPEGLKKGVLYRIDQATGKAKTPKRRWFGAGTAMGAVAAVLVLLVGVGVIPLKPQKAAAKPVETNAPAWDAVPETLAPEKTEPMKNPAALETRTAEATPLQPTETQTLPLDTGAEEPQSEAIPTDTASGWMQTPETAAPDVVQETAEKGDNYYLSGGDSNKRREPCPLDEETRALCAARSRSENRMLLLYTEFDAESILKLLKTEEPKLYELLADAPRKEEDGLCILDTSCGTVLALHEWLLENLPRSEVMDPEIRSAEQQVMIRMAALDPDNESLYRIITWEPHSNPVEWPEIWPDAWAVRLRTEENWALFFPQESYTPAADKSAAIAFLLPEED